MSGKNIVTCYDEINRFLGDFPYEKNNGDAIFVHESIIQLVSERLLSHGYSLKTGPAWNYDLNIGQKCYKMFLIWIQLDVLMSSKLHMIVSESKYSCPWHPNTTIYTTLDKFYLVEQFIKENNLEQFLPTIGIETNRLCVDADIKYAEFTREVTITDFLPKFRTFLEMNDYKLPNTYFACRAFKYLRPSYLAYHSQPYYRQDTITQLLLRNEDFNIFDLIAMKMATDDNRLDYINCEFHKLIDRKLYELSTDKKNLYISSRHFNLNKYHSEMGILGYSEEVYQYLVTHFYSHFDTIKVYRKYGTFKIKPKLVSNITDLLSRPLYCNKLHVCFKTLNQHNSDVLMTIIKNDNSHFLRTLTFDTDKPLENKIVTNTVDNCESILPSRDLHFKGKNSTHFVENLLNWMRFTMGSRWDNCDLRFIETQIQGASVLRGLTVRMIILKEVRITCKLLRALHHVKYEIIKLSKCYLENDPEIFMLLDSLGGDRYIQINIEDHTLKILFESIQKILMTTSRKEFQFQNYVTVYYLESKFEFIDLSRFKFFINEDGTKIEACDLYTNDTVNLFDYFYKPEAANLRSELEFYN